MVPSGLQWAVDDLPKNVSPKADVLLQAAKKSKCCQLHILQAESRTAAIASTSTSRPTWIGWSSTKAESGAQNKTALPEVQLFPAQVQELEEEQTALRRLDELSQDQSFDTGRPLYALGRIYSQTLTVWSKVFTQADARCRSAGRDVAADWIRDADTAGARPLTLA